ncbi:hypothetical protein AB0896_12950 [Streptomyces parvulus]|uniref:hypothetical protein n=1 Tax=Streptomyces parvulus TaxID=146923 RepID=UPI0034556FF3
MPDGGEGGCRTASSEGAARLRQTGRRGPGHASCPGGDRPTAARTVRAGEVFRPDTANHALYRRLEAVYRDVREQVSALYRRMYDAFG